MRNLARVHAGRPARFAGLRGAYAGGGASGRQVPEVNAAYIKLLSPIAWFRWGVGTTVATGVSQWNDQSGNGNHLKQATGATQPTLNANKTIRFTSAHRLICDPFTLNTPASVYLLSKAVTWTSGSVFYDGNTGGTMRLAQTGSTPEVAAGSVITLAWALGTYAATAVIFNGASSVLALNNTPVTGSTSVTSPGGFCLGAAPSSGFADLEVKEVIVFTGAHSGDTRRNVIRYLMDLGRVAP